MAYLGNAIQKTEENTDYPETVGKLLNLLSSFRSKPGEFDVVRLQKSERMPSERSGRPLPKPKHQVPGNQSKLVGVR